jgi:hypothetical protein
MSWTGSARSAGNVRYLVAALCLSLAGLGVLCGQAAPEGEGKLQDKVSVGVSVVMDSSPTRLALTISNEGTAVFQTDALGTPRSRLVISGLGVPAVEHALPLGRGSYGSGYFSSSPRRGLVVALASGESRTWPCDLSEVLRSEGLKPGLYEVVWRVEEMASGPVTVQMEAMVLRVKVVEGGAERLELTATNQGSETLRFVPFGSHSNHLIVTDGKQRTDMSVSAGGAPPRISVAPGESRSWLVGLQSYFEGWHVRPEGPYGIIWRLGNQESPPVWFTRTPDPTAEQR